MPRGPRGEERPADAIGCAVKVARIATGEVEDERAAELAGRQSNGGRARAEKLTPEERSEIARKAAAARWGGRQWTATRRPFSPSSPPRWP